VIDVINPATNQLICQLEEHTAAQITDQVQAAREAQPAWQHTPLEERAACIRRFAALLAERREVLARTTSLETGKPIAQAEGEIAGLSGRIDFFLEHVAAELADEQLIAPGPGVTAERIRHEPLGVIANISAWNYPYFVGGNVFLPALLTGNAVIYKPSELASMTGLMLGELLHQAGVPEQAFQVLIGGSQAGQALIDERLGGVFFTGSNRTGAHIAQLLAPRMVRYALELGGKDPAYIAEDVDVAHAAAAMAEGAFYNTGQSCCAVERVYVHQAIYADFLQAFSGAVRALKLGDPLDPETFIGPLARREPALAELERQVAEALELGGRLLTGGHRAAMPGSYFEPTVIADAPQASLLMQEESFGPIIGVASVTGDAEAVQQMNDTHYGLTAAVYTTDAARAEALLAQLDVGTGYHNCCDRVSPRLPWSGRRGSGLGSTLSTYGIEAFLRPKALHLRPASWT
jgi:acyl-CoA reductase-like NAD-dependent aldehyde dehydrogenase